ncbi:diguanylate cyclase [Endozoicomonas atrinae]|uniref:diguanylate cyclase n=1 Tax=Endozoicomonas atrinae TaxID=1333660 RepID=UPI003B006F54
MIQAFELVLKRWQNNIPEYLISPLTTGFRKISIGVVKDRCEQVTISLGVSSCVPSTKNVYPEQLIKCADEALYEAKVNGRNRVVKFGDSSIS